MNIFCVLVKSGAGCFFDYFFYQISRNIDVLKPSSYKRARGFRQAFVIDYQFPSRCPNSVRGWGKEKDD